MVEEPLEGLRARKKRATRQGIAATARRLFAERGYDAVTVAEIAAAADVSEKTVFNHFATKEDLVFSAREALLRRLVTDLEERPPGTAVLDVFRAATATSIDEIARADDERLTLPRIINGSPALQARQAAGWEDEARTLAAAVARTSGADGTDLVPAIVARTLWWTHRAAVVAALSGRLAGEDGDELAERLGRTAGRAYDQLAAGLAGYGAAAAP